MDEPQQEELPLMKGENFNILLITLTVITLSGFHCKKNLIYFQISMMNFIFSFFIYYNQTIQTYIIPKRAILNTNYNFIQYLFHISNLNVLQ
jgi:hypothetical protein